MLGIIIKSSMGAPTEKLGCWSAFLQVPRSPRLLNGLWAAANKIAFWEKAIELAGC